LGKGKHVKRTLPFLFCLTPLANGPLVPLVPINEASFQKLAIVPK